jgi:hypothetical protein
MPADAKSFSQEESLLTGIGRGSNLQGNEPADAKAPASAPAYRSSRRLGTIALPGGGYD